MPKIDLDSLPEPDGGDDPRNGLEVEDEIDDLPLVRAELLRSMGRMVIATYTLVAIFLASRGWIIVPARDPWPWHAVWAGIFAGVFGGFVGWVTWAFRRLIKVMEINDHESERLRILQRRQEIEDRELRELDEQYVNIQRAEREQCNYEAREKIRLRREKHQRQVEDAARQQVLDRQREIEADLTE
jgi:hypothetical protein